jgi:hypothetical protein
VRVEPRRDAHAHVQHLNVPRHLLRRFLSAAGRRVGWERRDKARTRGSAGSRVVLCPLWLGVVRGGQEDSPPGYIYPGRRARQARARGARGGGERAFPVSRGFRAGLGFFSAVGS